MNKFGFAHKIQKICLILWLGFWPLTSQAVTYSDTSETVIPNNDSTGVSATIVVPDTMTIADLDVDLKITHAWVGDLIVTLTHAESGRSLVLIDHIGINTESGDLYGCGLDNIEVTFNDEISQPSAESCAAASRFAYGVDGSSRYNTSSFSDTDDYINACAAADYQCDKASSSAAVHGDLLADNGSTGLGVFYGDDMAGTWTLQIVDNTIEDAGVLNAWSLTFLNTNCGNGTIEGEESCDDGNHAENDGCSEHCAVTNDSDADGFYDDVDCDDADAEVNPNAEEICNDPIDNDCDGESLFSQDRFPDDDGDGFGDADAAATNSCTDIADTVLNNDDCDDGDATVYPDAIEFTSDNIDNNCDGQVDESSTSEEDPVGEDDTPVDTGSDSDDTETTGDDGTTDTTPTDTTGTADAEELPDDAADEGADSTGDATGAETDDLGDSEDGDTLDPAELSKHPLKSDVVAGCSLQASTARNSATGFLVWSGLLILGICRSRLTAFCKKIF